LHRKTTQDTQYSWPTWQCFITSCEFTSSSFLY
jgi:hypothetical protein